MPNPRSPSPNNLGGWRNCTNVRNLPAAPGIYKFRRRYNGRLRTQYLGMTTNLNTRVRNHTSRRAGDKIQFKLVPHHRRMYRDPVSNRNRTRLNIAEKLHLRDEFSRGQNCRRSTSLRAWVRQYNNLPRNRRAIRLTRRSR
jgi:hypothetical protein